MRLISRLRDHRYCAFCRASRRVYVKKHIDMTNVVASIAFALVLTYSFWGEVDPRGLVFFGLFVVAAEIFVYMRWRLGIVCRLCGFDPVLYKHSPEKASARVRAFFAENADAPEFWLTKSPLLEVQRRLREHERQKAKYEKRSKISATSESSALTPTQPS